MTRSLSSSAQHTTAFQPPVNISFTATYYKNIIDKLMNPISVAIGQQGEVYVCDVSCRLL